MGVHRSLRRIAAKFFFRGTDCRCPVIFGESSIFVRSLRTGPKSLKLLIVPLPAAKSASRWAALSASVSAPSICALRLTDGPVNFAIVIGRIVGENSARREICD
jgi:hypothetical protein